MGRENTIRTGINTSTRMLDMASNAYSSRNFSSHFTYGLVRAVNTATKEIIYSPIASNIPSLKTGIAIPMSTNFVKLPEPNNIVRIFQGPNTDSSVANAPGAVTIYYDPNPVGVWQTVDNNKIEQSTTIAPKAKEVSVSNKDIKQTTTGIPHNTPNKPSASGVGPMPTHNTIISKPLESDDSFAIVIGGTPSSSYGASFMKKQAEIAGIISKKNIIFSDWENHTNAIMNKVKKDYPNATFSSFSGFSKGGENTSGEIGNFPFIGFMDPSLTASVVATTKDKPAKIASNGVYMMYNPNNWDNDYPQLAARQRAAGPMLGNRATLIKQIHGKFPVSFFQTYGNRL